MKRKHFILALVAMLLSFVHPAFAQTDNVAKVGNTEYATIDEAIAAWTNNTTLTLLSDVTLSDVVTLNSTEHHILNLGTYTMTAASGKNAIVIKACGTGDSERTAITINADAANPGGIYAGSKCVVYYKYADGGISGTDRPIIMIKGGVFTGSTSSYGTAGIYTIGTEARKCATLNISGGTFNCSINGSGKSKLIVSGGVFNYSVGSQGDKTAYRLISGGKFKTLGFMTADGNNTKFWFGTSMANSNVGLYVDDEGYLCVGGPVITELSPKYKAVAKNATKWSSYLAYSSAATNGLYYTNAEAAIKKHSAANVTVYEHAEVVEELDNNAAVKNFTPELPDEVVTFEVEAIDIEATAEATTKVTFNVEPKNASGAKVSNPSAAITFRLPVPAAWSGKANVYHEGTLLGAYTIKEENGAKYVEVSSANFSEFAVEAIVPLFAGEGTEASPYIIDSADKLAALSNSVNGGEAYAGMYFKLTSDITLSGEWTAIGNGSRSSKSYTGNAFKGVFDGSNNTISGLTITSTTAADAAIGLFGVVDGGTVKNLNLTNVNINVSSSNLAGAAIGMMLNKATADNITVSGAIVGNDGVGGIVGRMIINGTIANCTNNASVTTSYGGIGGIVGKPYYDNASNTSDFATITNCVNNGTITAGSYAGGIAGLARANVTGCVNNGEIKGGTQTGGIIGELIAAGTVSGNENKGKVSGTSHVGGIIGDYTQTSAYSYYNVTIANNINRGEIAATGDRAAILGCNNVDGFTAMTATGNVSYYFVEGLVLFGNPEDMVIDATNKFVVPVAQIGTETFYTLAEAVAVAQAGDEIVIIANVELTETTEFPAGKTITLNLNNKKVSAADKNVIKNSGAALTIKNGTIERTGTVAGYAVNVVSGTLEVENVTIVGGLYTYGTSLVATNTNISQASASRHAIYAYNCAVTINSGTYHNDNAGNAAVFAYGSSVVTINNGTFSIDNGKQTLGWTSCLLDANAGGKYVINGGEFKGHFRVQANSAMEINGGTFENTHNEAYNIIGTAEVKGGTFTDAAAQTFAKNNIADDYKLGEDGKVVYAPVVAKIGETKYETLDAAVAAAKEGDKITLLNDAELLFASNPMYNNVKASEIDLNGKTMTIKKGDVRFSNTTIKNGNIIVQPGTYNGTSIFLMYSKNLTFDAVKVTATGVASTYLIDLEGTSNLNLLNGSEILVDNTTAIATYVICSNNGATENKVVIDNSKVTVNNIDGRVFFGGNYTVKDSEINLAGITKAGFRINAGQTLSIEGTSKVNIEGEPRDGGIHLVALTSTYTKAETATVTATVNRPAVAKIGDTPYYSFAEAAAAANAGDEIVMLADATVEVTQELPAGIKLASNGHTINGSIRMLGDLTLNGPLTITGGLWVGKGGETLTATLSGDKLTASYFMFQRGTYTINADIDAVYGYLSYEATFEVNSTIHTTGANGEVLYINGNVTLNDGAVLDSDNSVFVCNDNAVLTLKPGSKVDSNVSITKSGAKLNIDATGMAAGASANITGTVTNSGNGTIAVVGNDNLEASIVNGKVVLAAKPVAKIGETYYATLAKAIAAATAGQTITLAADVTEDVTLSKAVTIDGTGKTYTGAMTLKADATFKNVNFDGKGYNGYAITTRGAQYLTIDGGSAKNYGYGFVQLASATVLTTVKNVTVSNMNYGVKVDYSGAVVLDSVDITAGVAAVLNSNYGEKTITIKDSKLNILGTWERNTTIKTTYAFEGANTVDKFVTVDAIDVFKLAAAGTTLTAPEGKTVTTDVKYNRVVYADGKYALELCPARIGEQGYATLQEAINAVQNGQEVVLLKDCAENVTLTEKVGLYYTINGDGKTLNGKITITPLSDERDNRRITIKNIKFENTADVARDFISCAVTNHYPRLTVEGCTFTGNGKNTDVALRLKTAYDAVIKNCTGTGLHSFLQNTAGKNFTIENVIVTNSKSGFALGTVQGVTVKGANIDVAGYGIRMDAQYNNKAVIESNTVKAFIPVVVRKAEVNSDVTVKGENTMTATNTDGIWFAAGTSEYETNGTMPTAATGKVKVTLEDKNLDLNGVYGNYGVASIGNAKFNTLAEAVNAAQAGSEIKLLADVTLAGGYEDAAEGLRIEKEITLNGNGYTINCGNFLKGIRIYNPSNVGDFNVNFNNVKVVNNVANGRCIDTRSGNINLKVNSSTLIATNGNSQPLTIGGNDPVHRVTLNGTTIDAGTSGYAVISFVSTNVDINGANNSTISGFAAFYLKGDAKTTNLNLGQGIYTGTNNHAVESGVFGTIVLEGDNNVVNLMGTNATVKAVAENTAPQAAFLVRGANNTIKITKESAKIITEGNAYEAMVDAGNAATTKFVDMGIERKLVAENRGYQFYSFEEAVRFAGNEGTIKVVNDFELAEAWTIPAEKKYTLDLNGKTVSMVYAKDATANHTMISNSGNLTIQSSVEGGKLSYTYTGANLGTSHSANTVTSNPGSVLTVKSGTIENLTFDSGIIAYAIDGLTNGGAGDVTVNIEGGVITSKRQAVRIFANSTTNTGALNISGGKFTGRVIVQNASAKANKAALNITGGTFNANEYKSDVLYVGGSSSATIDINATVSGGTFNGEITETNVAGFISGGTFANPVAPEFCAAGFMPNKNTDGTYGVVVASGMVATTNGFGYATLAEAIKACVAGDNTITLLADCAEKVTITQVNGTNITINGNGKTYTGTITVKGDKVANNLYNTETLTFKNINFAPAYNTYAITAEKNTYARNITVDGCTFKGNNDVYGIRVRNGYNYTVKNTTVEGVYTFFNASEALNGLTVENVTVKCASVAFSGAYGYGNASFKNVTVESGNNGIKVNNPNGSALTFETCSITAKAPVTFYENAGVTSALTAEFNGTNTMVVSEGGTYWFNIVEADATDATFKAIVNDAALDMSNTAFAASVGNVYYSSLQKAINAAVDGDVVTLAKNIELDAANCVTNSGGYSVFVNVVGKAVTIDLNGKAVTANLSASQFASAKSKLLMAVFSVDTNGNLTLNDSKGTGKVAVTANDASVYSLISNYDSSAKLTINGGSYWLDKARAASSLIHSDPSEAVVVNGGNFYLGNVNTGANGSPWIFNVNGNNTGHVIVNGGTFNYDINHQYWAFEVHVDKALTLKNNGDGTWTVVPAVAYVVEENNGYTRETGYETLKEAMSSKYGNEVTLLVDVDTTEVILIDKSLTINGNGHKVASSATRVFRVTTGDTEVTLNGVSMVSNAVRVGTNDIRGISIDIVNNVKLTLNNSSVDFTDASANDWAYALNVTGGENHVVTVNGGTYEGANVINVRGANNAVTVKDATLTSTYPNNDQYFGACIWVLQNQNSSVEATGNTFNGSNAIAFNLGTGTALTESENIDNTKMIVAKVDSEYYTSLAEAVAAADGNTVKILHSFDTDETATVNGDVTLDLNGKTITGTPSEAKAYAVITNKGTLTITGNGTVLCDHKLAGSTGYAVNTITNLGTLNIEDGVIIENKSTAQHQIGYAIDNNSTSTDAVVNIYGGKVTASGSLYYDGIRQFCNSETKENSVVVEGGEVSTIWMQNPSDGATKNTKDVKGSIAISGGNVGVLSLEPSASFEADVTGGYVGEISYFQTAAGRDLVEFVTDGTFGTKIDEAFLALGYQLTGNAAPYGVKYTGKREALTIDVAEYKDEYKNTQKLSVKTLTFKRKLNAGAWNAFFVPFEVPLKDLMENYDVAYLNDASFYDRDENGSIEEITVQYVKFTEAHKDKKLFANHPYRIRPKNADAANMNLVLTDVELQTTEMDKRKVLRCGGVYTNIEWHGLYERSYASDFLDGNNANDMCFAENSKGTFQNIGEHSVAPFRVMMVMTNSDEMPYTFDEEALANVRAITLGEDEFDATGIINIGSDQEKSDLIFDLQGRRVLSPVKGNLYIINGKKVVY